MNWLYYVYLNIFLVIIVYRQTTASLFDTDVLFTTDLNTKKAIYLFLIFITKEVN